MRWKDQNVDASWPSRCWAGCTTAIVVVLESPCRQTDSNVFIGATRILRLKRQNGSGYGRILRPAIVEIATLSILPKDFDAKLPNLRSTIDRATVRMAFSVGTGIAKKKR